jgi:hypothetical protein
MKRDYNDKQYKAWRAAVRKRDGSKCMMPKCTMKRRVVVHHIKRWADYPELRYIVSNGICLCRKCHISIQNKEEMYEALFMTLISPVGISVKEMIRERK